MTGIAAFFQTHPLLRDVDPQTRDELAAAALERSASKGQTLYRPDEAWPYLGMLVDGTLGMFAESGGRDYLYEEVTPGGFFGVSGMFDERAAMARMVVLTKKARYAAVENGVVRRLCDRDARLAMLLATVLAERVRRLTALLATQVTLPTMTRMARYLLQHAADSPGLCAIGGALPHMTQAQIAAAAGTTKEVTTRLLRTLEDASALRRERGHIKYLDRERLAQFASPSH